MGRVEHIFSLNFYFMFVVFSATLLLLSVFILSLRNCDCDLNLKDINTTVVVKFSFIYLPKKAKVINEYNIKSFNKSFHCDNKNCTFHATVNL